MNYRCHSQGEFSRMQRLLRPVSVTSHTTTWASATLHAFAWTVLFGNGKEQKARILAGIGMKWEIGIYDPCYPGRSLFVVRSTATTYLSWRIELIIFHSPRHCIVASNCIGAIILFRRSNVALPYRRCGGMLVAGTVITLCVSFRTCVRLRNTADNHGRSRHAFVAIRTVRPDFKQSTRDRSIKTNLDLYYIIL